jgi:hypothetical protein
MGRLARLALLEGANTDPSPEIRTRCQSLLPRATSQEMQARLAVFLADTKGRYEHDLPGWGEFRGLVRDEWTFLGHPIWSDKSLDVAARQVFAELLGSPVNRQIMMAVGSQQADLGTLVGNRRTELYYLKFPRTVVIGGRINRPAPPRDPSLADITTLLFAESQAGAKAARGVVSSISSLITTSGFPTAARGDSEQAKVYRAVAAGWLDSRTEPMDQYYAMNLANTFDMPERGLQLSVRLFENKAAVVTYRGMAAQNLARLGNKSLLPLLEKAMTDTASITTARRVIIRNGRQEILSTEIQIRDVALAVSLTIAGQRLEDYGFEDAFPGNGAGYSYSRYHFPDYGWFWSPDDARKRALAKWKNYRAKNP